MRAFVFVGAVFTFVAVCVPDKSDAAEVVGIQIPCGASSFALPGNAPSKLQEAALEYCLTQIRQAMAAPPKTPVEVAAAPGSPIKPTKVTTKSAEAPTRPAAIAIPASFTVPKATDEPIATAPGRVSVAKAAKPAEDGEETSPSETPAQPTTSGCKKGQDPKKDQCVAEPLPKCKVGETPSKDSCKESATVLSAKDFYVGSGFAISQTIGSRKTQDIKFVTRTDGRLLAQIQKSEDRDIGVMFETHYLMRNQGMFGQGKGAVEKIGNFFACGPFSLIGKDDERKGCGPLFTAILDTDGSISKFGIGWALGLGGKKSSVDREESEERAGFGIGVGLLFDKSSKTVDGRLVDKDTMLVRPEYQTDVAAGTISPIVERPTTSIFVMVSKTF